MDRFERAKTSADETVSGVEMVCANCGLGIDYKVSPHHSGTNDLVLVPEPCIVCYPSPEEQGYALGVAKEEAEEDTTEKVLMRLLELSRAMSTNDWDCTPDQSQEHNLRKLIDADDDLSAFLYSIDRKEKRNADKK